MCVRMMNERLRNMKLRTYFTIHIPVKVHASTIVYANKRD